MHYKKLEGEKVYLSPMNESDFEIITKWWNDYDVMSSYGGLDINFNELTQKRFIENSNRNGNHNYLIILKENNKPIGKIGVWSINRTARRYSMDILIGEKEYQSSGFGTEAASLMVDYAFNVLNANSLCTEVFEFNKRSCGLTEKLGFKKIGIQRAAHYQGGKYINNVAYDLMKDEYIK